MVEKSKQKSAGNAKNKKLLRKSWSLKRRLIVIALAPLVVCVLGFFVLLGIDSYQCGQFELRIFDVEPPSSPVCPEPPHDRYSDQLGIGYLVRASEYEQLTNYQSDDYTKRIYNDLPPPYSPSVYIRMRSAQTKPLTDEEQAYIDSGKRACNGVVYTKSGLEKGVYLYQIRKPKYIYTITHDNRDNNEEGKQKGQEILSTFFSTVHCKD